MAGAIQGSKRNSRTSLDEFEETKSIFEGNNDGNIHQDEEPPETEAHILPETERQPRGDLEKQQGKSGAPHPGVNPADFPDGGLEAWLVVLGGWCCLFCSFGWINAIGVFQNYYEKEWPDVSPSTIAWIPSLETFFMFVGGPLWGKLYDNYGPRYILLAGSFLHVFGLMMTSISTQYYQVVLAQGVCSPIGASMIFYPAMGTIATWFWKWRALSFGVIASGSSIGGIIFPVMVEHLIPEVGFGWAMRICAFLILFLTIIANLTVKSRIPPVPKRVELMEFIRPLGEMPFLLTALGSAIFFLGLFLPINYLIVQAQEEGMSAYLAGYLVVILNALSIFGRTLPGYVGDLIGRFNVMIIMCLFTMIMVWALWIPAHGSAAIIVFAALYGFGSGTFVSMIPALVATISDVRKIGVRNGTLFAINSIAALVSNPIGGAIIDAQNGKFIGLKIFCGACLTVGTILIAFARVSVAGVNMKKKI